VDTPDSQGNVYVADMHNDGIQVFISSDTFIKMCGTEGKGNGKFSELEGIDVDS
jgi:hypothetical protein